MICEVSVFIPAYNAGRFIKDAISSVLAQGLESYEIVIVDDASTDDTQRQCKSAIAKHPKVSIRYFRNEINLGGGGNRNVCVSKCRGTYLFNLDADDVLPRNLLRTLLDVAKRTYQETAVHFLIRTASSRYFEDRKRAFWLTAPFRLRAMRRSWVYDNTDYRHVLTNMKSPASSCAYLFHRDIFYSVGGYFDDCGAYDVWSFGIRCYGAGYRFKVVANTFYWHRLHPDSYWTRGDRTDQNRMSFYTALSHLKGLYSDETLKTLHPNNPDYPSDPFQYLELRDSLTPSTVSGSR
jgi:glycosyltransferase involved in cell wall biosynthesis